LRQLGKTEVLSDIPSLLSTLYLKLKQKLSGKPKYRLLALDINTTGRMHLPAAM
jgi:hypothetical protein